MTKLALCDVRGPLADLTEKLSGENGEQWLNALKSFLRKQNAWEVHSIPSIFKTVTLHNATAKAYKESLKSAGFPISTYASEIFTKVTFQQGTFDLVVLSVAELGFPNGATWEQICARAQQRGLSLCPAEVGPALRLAYPEQPSNEWLLIAMEPITVSSGSARVFYVGNDEGRWLSATGVGSGYVWSSTECWVFWRK